MNTQRQFSLAFQNYEAHHKHFPGYANRITKKPDGNSLVSSWIVPLFSYLDRADLDTLWNNGDARTVDLNFVRCLSNSLPNSRRDPTSFSYVVNCGLPGDADTKATGVFHNHNIDGKPVYVCMWDLYEHDGGSYTLMLSENLQAGRWTDTEEANVGMVWFRKPDECSGINQCRDVGERPQKIRYARPSSNHPGGVIASFCDGHLQFLSDTIDYTVYQQLMAPDDKAAGLPGGFNPAALDGP